VALARGVAEEMQVTTEAHQITVQAEQPSIVGHWDPAALRQVLTNLVDNAIKYTPGGPIEIRVRCQDGEVVASVTDHGPGIPSERLALLFEAFAGASARELRRPGGLGLGLYISRGIVQAHRGRIWVESQLGVGSTFSFSLPLGRETCG
ncbi:MAG: ATP-binding protein, partial [Anaerolineae bacterium]|nr:ATP-binding protein [Anaerolineae bacterium]